MQQGYFYLYDHSSSLLCKEVWLKPNGGLKILLAMDAVFCQSNDYGSGIYNELQDIMEINVNSIVSNHPISKQLYNKIHIYNYIITYLLYRVTRI